MQTVESCLKRSKEYGGSLSVSLAFAHLSVSWACLFCGLLRYLVVLQVAGCSIIGPSYLVRRGLLRISGNSRDNEHAEIRPGAITARGHLNTFFLGLFVRTYLQPAHSLIHNSSALVWDWRYPLCRFEQACQDFKP